LKESFGFWSNCGFLGAEGQRKKKTYKPKDYKHSLGWELYDPGRGLRCKKKGSRRDAGCGSNGAKKKRNCFFVETTSFLGIGGPKTPGVWEAVECGGPKKEEEKERKKKRKSNKEGEKVTKKRGPKKTQRGVGAPKKGCGEGGGW